MLAGRSWTAALAIVLVLAGCDSGNGDDNAPAAGLNKGESWQEQRQLAQAALARYDAAMAKSTVSGAPAVSPSAWDPTVMSYGLSIESATLDARGTRMTVSFTGSPGPAAQPCGIDYSAEPVESDKAVVVIVLEQPNGYSGPCTLMGMTRTAALNLAKPLGDRAVLPIRGEPVPVTRTAGTK
jgi:hypothetical protein